MKRIKQKRSGLLIATIEQLKSIGIDDIPNGALVEIYEIDKYQTPHGLGSKMKYKYKKFDYIIPTKWVLFNQ